MPAPCCSDLRLRVVDAVRSGMTCEEVTRRFRVSRSTLLRWVRRLRESGHHAALPVGGRKPFVLADEREWLPGRFAAKPDLTLRELLSELHGRDVAVSCYALCNVVRRAGLRFRRRPCTRARANAKRLPLGAARCCPPPRRMAALAATTDQRPGLCVHRRDLGQNQHDPTARMVPARRAPGQQGAARPLENADPGGSLAPRRHHRRLRVRRPDQRTKLSRRCP